MKKLLQYFIFSQLLISIAAGLLFVANCSLLGLNIYSYGLVLFGGTLVAYSYLRIKHVSNKEYIENETNRWLTAHKILVYFLMMIGMTICIYFLFNLLLTNWLSIAILTVGFGIAVLYSGINQKLNIRRISLLKTPLVALVWSITTVLFPISIANIDFQPHLLLFLSNFLLILALTIPFEIKDMKFDILDKNLNTIPMAVGLNGTKIISIALLILSFVTLSLYDNFNASILLYTIAMSVIIFSLNEKRSFYWFDGILDFSIIIYSLIIIYQNL